MEKTCSLSELRTGQRARVEDVGKDGAFTRRMLEMGLTPGTRVRMGRRAPMGDPIEVWLRGYALTLRGRDIRGVRVRPVDP